jgi:cyclophilin family peptidyl-prolyl cis-trans isomerase
MSPSPTPSSNGVQSMSSQQALDLTVDSQGLSKAVVTLQTQHGPIKFKFYTQDAPKTVNRFVQLIQQGFYNGLSFHRVVPGFVIQGGDPVGNGTGGSGQHLEAEFNRRHHVEGTVAMARAQDPNSADSQFYICLGTFPHLDRNYTVFGQVIEGMDAVKKIQVGDKMTSVTVE